MKADMVGRRSWGRLIWLLLQPGQRLWQTLQYARWQLAQVTFCSL